MRAVFRQAARLRAASQILGGSTRVSPRRLNWKPNCREHGSQCSQPPFLVTPKSRPPRYMSARISRKHSVGIREPSEDISQIIKQHDLVQGCFETMWQHDGNLDLCTRCD